MSTYKIFFSDLSVTSKILLFNRFLELGLFSQSKGFIILFPHLLLSFIFLLIFLTAFFKFRNFFVLQWKIL